MHQIKPAATAEFGWLGLITQQTLTTAYLHGAQATPCKSVERHPGVVLSGVYVSCFGVRPTCLGSKGHVHIEGLKGLKSS